MRWKLQLNFVPFPSTNVEPPAYLKPDSIPGTLRMKLGDSQEFNTGLATADTAEVSVSVISKTPWQDGFISYEMDATTFVVAAKITPKSTDYYF